jgi:hypothetical protein
MNNTAHKQTNTKKSKTSLQSLRTPHNLECFLSQQPWMLETHRLTTKLRFGRLPRWYALDIVVLAREPLESFIERLREIQWIKRIVLLDQKATRKAYRITFKTYAAHFIFYNKFLNW